MNCTRTCPKVPATWARGRARGRPAWARGVGARLVPWAPTRFLPSDPLGSLLAAGTRDGSDPSTGGRVAAVPLARRAAPRRTPAAGPRSVCLSASSEPSAYFHSLSAPAPGFASAAPSAAAWLLISRLASPGGRPWPSLVLLAQPTSESASSCGPARGRSHQGRPLRRTVDGAVLFRGDRQQDGRLTPSQLAA